MPLIEDPVLLYRAGLSITSYHVRTSSEMRVYGHGKSSGCVVPGTGKFAYSHGESQCDCWRAYTRPEVARQGSARPPDDREPVRPPIWTGLSGGRNRHSIDLQQNGPGQGSVARGRKPRTGVSPGSLLAYEEYTPRRLPENRHLCSFVRSYSFSRKVILLNATQSFSAHYFRDGPPLCRRCGDVRVYR